MKISNAEQKEKVIDVYCVAEIYKKKYVEGIVMVTEFVISS